MVVPQFECNAPEETMFAHIFAGRRFPTLSPHHNTYLFMHSSRMSKIVLITGCSDGGIGHALALNFAERGLTVFAAARSTANITGLEPYFKVHLLNLDVTDQTSIAAVVEAVKAKAGRLDFLVNNAGRGYHMPVLDSDEEESRKIFEVNFWGTQELSIGPSGSKRVGSVVYSMRRLTLAGALRMSQAFLPMLIASKGSIVNTGSIIAYSCSPYNGTQPNIAPDLWKKSKKKKTQVSIVPLKRRYTPSPIFYASNWLLSPSRSSLW